jgi:hypothetical protein
VPQQDPELDRLREQAKAAAGETPPTPQPAQSNPLNAFNPRLTVFGDLTFLGVDGDLLGEDGNDLGNRFSLRETEIDFRADVDPHAKGVLIVALAEETPGEYALEVEEGYVTLESLPWNLRAKAGRMRTPFGQVNRLHTHDLPQTDRPLVVRTFLGAEGDVATGVNLEFLVPAIETPTLRFEAQVQNGENETILAGADAEGPAFVGRGSAFFDLGSASFFELGSSVLLGRSEPEGGQTTLSGIDAMWKWRPAGSSEQSLVVHSEFFWLDREYQGEIIASAGAFGSATWQCCRNWYLGARGDWSELADHDRGYENAWSLWASYYASEFLRVRLGFQQTDGPGRPTENVGSLQLTFVFGSHPVHPYWVNR